MKLVWLLHIIHLCSFVERFWTSTKLSRHVRLLPDDILITQSLVRVMDAKIKFTETLTSGLESMLASGAHADVTIVVDGKVFPCHKVSTLFFVWFLTVFMYFCVAMWLFWRRCIHFHIYFACFNMCVLYIR